ncbi:MAG: hypothetical protein AAF637_20490 [Pseudomonadota bacterium]
MPPTLSRLALASIGGAMMLSDTSTANAAPQVIELTQTGCQFLESENGVDYGYAPQSADDCEVANAETGDKRLAEAKVLELTPGDYVFRVSNVDVPYDLGFWIREADYQAGNPFHKLTKTSVSGGGLVQGETHDYEVELEPGEYVYSCPLNPTLDYRIVVKG